MKKVGIITFHFADNFGAVLQAYALTKKIENYGINVEIINFTPQKLRSPYALFPNIRAMLSNKGISHTIRTVLGRIYNIKYYVSKIRNFNNFRKMHLYISQQNYKTADELKDVENRYDYCITGSDQVWNPKFFSGFRGSYFLDFAGEKTKKISYAASISEKVETTYYKQYFEYLQDFNNISVREESAKDFLESIINKKIEVTLDPTLLLNKDEWNEIATCKKSCNQYILVYNLVNDPIVVKLANKISRETSYRIVSYSKKSQFINWDSSFSSCNPTEFLSLFANAELIITNSFHGTAFALIYNKLFFTIPHPVRGSRMIDLLLKLGLDNQLIRNEQDVENLNKDIDYNEVNSKLLYMKKQSINFLEQVLEIGADYNNED